jgi:hypothetical protein
MKMVLKVLGLIALVAIIGFSMAACDDGNGSGGTGGGNGGNTQNPGGGGTNPGGGSSPSTYSIEGNWAEHIDNYVGFVIKISGSTGVFTQLNKVSGLWQNAVDKGYIKVGDQRIRNLIKTGDQTWSCKMLEVTYEYSNPNVATGTVWQDATLTMSENGQKLTDGDGITWARLQ